MKKIISLGDLGISVPEGIKERTSETRFKAQDLKKILMDETLLNRYDIENLARNIFQILTLDSNQNRIEFTNEIFDKFEQADHMKQALFIQGLERMVQKKTNTKFRKFFESWEEHIQR